MTTTPDAVDALECAILEATDGYTNGVANAVANFLELEGFTISRAGPAMSDNEFRFRLLGWICQNDEVSVTEMVEFALELTKKYRGK